MNVKKKVMYKNKLYIKGLLLMALSLGACHDQLLNPVPESVLTTANAFNKASDLNLAVLGIYSAYQSRLTTDYELMEAPSDNYHGYYFAVSPGMAEIALLSEATANAFNKASDLNLAVLGIYSAYQSRLPTDYELMEAPSDNLYGYYFAVSPGMAEIALLTVAPENPKLNAFWKASYNGIFRANNVLANIDNPT